MTTRFNKHDLASKLAESDLFDTKKSALEALELITSTIAGIVVEGNAVAIPDFGKFEAYTRENGKVKPKFTPFTSFKERVDALSA